MIALICLACSATKLHRLGEMPLIDRYDGPMWKTLRAALADVANKPRIMVLSARFGFIDATVSTSDYDMVLTPARAKRLLEGPMGEKYQFANAVEEANATLFAGGALYRDMMRKAAHAHLAKVAETDGCGIGHQRAQLRAWIVEHCQ